MNPPTKEEYEAARKVVDEYWNLVMKPKREQEAKEAILLAESLVGKFYLPYSGRLCKIVKAEGPTIFTEQVDWNYSGPREEFIFSKADWGYGGSVVGEISNGKFLSKPEARQIIEPFIKRLQEMVE